MSSIFSRRSFKADPAVHERAEEIVKPGTRTLETDEIGKAYGGRRVVRGVNIHIAQGEEWWACWGPEWGGQDDLLQA